MLSGVWRFLVSWGGGGGGGRAQDTLHQNSLQFGPHAINNILLPNERTNGGHVAPELQLPSLAV